MAEEFLNYKSPGGRTYRIPSTFTEDQIREAVTKIDQQERVEFGALNRYNQSFSQSGAPNAFQAGVDEFGRNFLYDVPANVEAMEPNWFTDLLLKERANFGNAEDSAFGHLVPRDFYERRAAHREAQDQYTANSGLPELLDDALSLAGVLLAPGPKGGRTGSFGRRMAGAAGGGAVEGAASGVLEGEGMSPEEQLQDFFFNTMLGTAAGGAIQAGGEAISGGVQRAYGRPDSLEAYLAQSKAGMTPTAGSVGNPRAAMAENTLIDYPFSLNRMVPLVPDTASKRTKNQQVLSGQYDEAMDTISPGYEPRAESRFNAESAEAIQDTRARLKQDRRNLSEEMLAEIPPDTPVRTTPIEELPENMRAGSRDVNLVGRAQEDVNRLMANPATVTDDPLYRALSDEYTQLTEQRGKIAGNIEKMKADRAELINNPQKYRNGARRAERLERHIASAEEQLGKIDTNITDTQRRVRDNRTRTFGATKDWRSTIGEQGADAGGLGKYEKDELYEVVTRQLEEAGGDKFKELNDQIRQKYADDDTLKAYFGETPSNTFSRMKTLFTKGNREVLETMERTMDPQEWAAIRAGTLDELSRDSKGQISMQNFWKSFGGMGETEQRALAGSDEAFALLKSLEEVTKTLDPSVVNRNFSGTAASGGLLGTIAVSPDSAAKFMVRLGIVDAAMASDMMASAVAGKPDALTSALKAWARKSQTRGDEDTTQVQSETLENAADSATSAVMEATE